MQVTEARSPFRPLRNAPAYRALSTQVERLIISGQLKPGDTLPTETELAQRFAVNRSTVREAIRLLEQEGLILRAAGRRLQVATPGLFDLAPRATRALLLQHVTFEELWQVAVEVEPVAGRLAARNAKPADLEAIAANVDATARTIADGASSIELDVEFHALVARASGNRVLMLAREPISLLYAPVMRELERRLPQAVERNLLAHRRILAALEASDPAEAERWTRKHLIDFERGVSLAGLDLDTVLTAPVEPLFPAVAGIA